MSEQKLAETRDYAVSQNITIMRNRVNELGVAEPVIQRQGSNRIVVELRCAGYSKSERDFRGYSNAGVPYG